MDMCSRSLAVVEELLRLFTRQGRYSTKIYLDRLEHTSFQQLTAKPNPNSFLANINRNPILQHHPTILTQATPPAPNPHPPSPYPHPPSLSRTPYDPTPPYPPPA